MSSRYSPKRDDRHPAAPSEDLTNDYTTRPGTKLLNGFAPQGVTPMTRRPTSRPYPEICTHNSVCPSFLHDHAGPRPVGSYSPSSTAPLPHPILCCCASQAALTSRCHSSSTATTPHRPRSPRRCAPLWAPRPTRSPGPPCANACASTTLASASPCKLSNNAASPSVAPTVGACRRDHHRCPASGPQADHCSAVPPFRTRDALGTKRLPPTLRAIYRATNLGWGRATQQRRRRRRQHGFGKRRWRRS